MSSYAGEWENEPRDFSSDYDPDIPGYDDDGLVWDAAQHKFVYPDANNNPDIPPVVTEIIRDDYIYDRITEDD